MSLQGVWSGEGYVFQQHIELVYDASMGLLNDNLRIPNTDTPIYKIELLEIRLDHPTPLSLLSIGFKNKNIPIKNGTYGSRTIASIYNVSISDATVHGNEYNVPPVLYMNIPTKRKDNSPEFRLDIFAYPSMTPLAPSLAFIRLRVSRHVLEGTSTEMKHEPQILLA